MPSLTITLRERKQAVQEPENWHGPEDSSARLRSAWDDDHLYFALEITDDELVEARGWSGDCVELFLDADVLGDLDRTALDQDDRQLFVNAPLPHQWPEGELDCIEKIEGGRVAGRKTSTGYVLEVAIPWDNFIALGAVPLPGEVLGLGPTLCDRDADGWSKLSWTEDMNVYLNTALFGRLVLVAGDE